MEKGIFGKRSFSRIIRRPIADDSSEKALKQKSGPFSHWRQTEEGTEISSSQSTFRNPMHGLKCGASFHKQDLSLPSTTLKLLHNLQPLIFGIFPPTGIVHSSKFATGTSPMTTPIIQPGRLTLGQSPPSAKESVDICENIGVDLDQISTNIADKLNICSKSMENTEPKGIATSKMSVISDGKVFDHN